MYKPTGILLCLVLGCLALEGLGKKNAEVFQPVRQMLVRLHLTAEEFQSLADGHVIVRALSSHSPRQMAALGVVLADASPNGFVEAYKTLAVYQNNPCITEIGLFGSTPAASDLGGLTIDPIDLYGLRRARAGDSDIKLSGEELKRIQRLAGSRPNSPVRAKDQLAQEYKRILLDRVIGYLGRGDQAMGAYVDKAQPVEPGQVFESLADEQSAESSLCRDICEYLKAYPTRLLPKSESFLYWAKQEFRDLKSVISIVHLVIHREGERVFIASKQIYSSHYNEAGLAVAELMPFADDRGRTHTVVVYTVRLEPDMLGGTLGFVKKRMAMPKMEITLRDSLGRIRDNLERGGGIAVR